MQMVMNRHGADAKAYWHRWLPERYASIDGDRDAFFTRLGEEVEEQTAVLWHQLIAKNPGPDGETHTDRTGRLAHLRETALGLVLEELVRLPPEPGTKEPDDDTGLESDAEFAARLEAFDTALDEVDALCTALLDDQTTVAELTDEQLRAVVDHMTPEFLRVLGTSVDEQRELGRPL